MLYPPKATRRQDSARDGEHDRAAASRDRKSTRIFRLILRGRSAYASAAFPGVQTVTPLEVTTLKRTNTGHWRRSHRRGNQGGDS